eukprot:Protomagalhaensia_wolfi_Nauph_80__4994@NODE_527_length_2376_cov_8_179290_g381_i1_p2_GENE_NODE_527_length_2376_cov_8_179290_g381_i1NODE_527_length_2376_cov_8_179290_g381_i1_p2_ORF_typecomplete_len216_score49_61Helicase_C/PF00271_31/4_7e27Helicase_C/PF00271_31/2_3e03ERCC3_RAD25_C/PF16203_5/2e09UTP25/PF06862_12/0_039_NODE_527_length_2376_cov_8_179290_g381_i115522199
MTPCPLQKIALTATNVQNYKGFGLLRLKLPIQITGILMEPSRTKHYYVRAEQSPATVAKLVEAARGKHMEKQCLIFCASDAQCQALSANLTGLGIKCGVLSADMSRSQRRQALQTFRQGAFPCLACTDLAARGLDIASICAVIHFNLPIDAESYIHRVGRTSRANRKGRSYVLVPQSRDLEVLNKVIHLAQKHRAFKVKEYKKELAIKSEAQTNS